MFIQYCLEFLYNLITCVEPTESNVDINNNDSSAKSNPNVNINKNYPSPKSNPDFYNANENDFLSLIKANEVLPSTIRRFSSYRYRYISSEIHNYMFDIRLTAYLDMKMKGYKNTYKYFQETNRFLADDLKLFIKYDEIYFPQKYKKDFVFFKKTFYSFYEFYVDTILTRDVMMFSKKLTSLHFNNLNYPYVNVAEYNKIYYRNLFYIQRIILNYEIEKEENKESFLHVLPNTDNITEDRKKKLEYDYLEANKYVKYSQYFLNLNENDFVDRSHILNRHVNVRFRLTGDPKDLNIVRTNNFEKIKNLKCRDACATPYKPIGEGRAMLIGLKYYSEKNYIFMNKPINLPRSEITYLYELEKKYK